MGAAYVCARLMPALPGAALGRDHNHWGFSLWMAGGGIKRGTVYGATDEFGFKAAVNKATVYDFNATILHLLGIDHERLTFKYQGRHFRLTDVHGHVIKEILKSTPPDA